MRTDINGKIYVTKFQYGKAKNPTKGKWRNRSSVCNIFPVIDDKVSETPIATAKVYNCHGEPFVRALGRYLSFRKAVRNSDLVANETELVESFVAQCPSSMQFEAQVQEYLELSEAKVQ